MSGRQTEHDARAMTPGRALTGLAAVAAAGQLSGKSLLYLAGRGVLNLP